MSKSQNKQINKSDFGTHFFLLGGIVFLLFFLHGFGISPLKTLEKKISQMQANAENTLKNQYNKDSKISTNLFQKNLNKENTDFEISNTIALTHTQKYIQEKYNCEISLSEIASYIYLKDPAFQKYINTPKKNEKTNTKDIPRKENTAQACLKLTKCITPNAMNNMKLSTCSDIVLNAYIPSQKAANEQQQIQTTNLNNNKYQNGDIKDANYDILKDIEYIGKLWFDGFKVAPEIILYAVPNFSTNNQTTFNSSSNSNTNTNEETTQTNNKQNASNEKDQQNTIQNEEKKEENTDSIQIDPPTQDDEINDFLTNQNSIIAKNENDEVLFTNKCLPPDTTHTSTSTNKKAGQNSETIANQTTDTTNTSTIDLQKNQSNLQKITTPKIPQKTINNTNSAGLEANFPGKSEQEAESCVQKCNARDEKGKYQLALDERQICKLQCLCGEYTSPQLEENADFPILNEGALKIRFCTIPAKGILSDPNSKRIYSITEIIKEIENVGTTLNIGGKLTPRESKTEFLDSNLTNRSLNKTTAIFVNLQQRAATPNTTETDKKVDNTMIISELEKESGFGRNSFILSSNQSSLQKTLNTPQSKMTQPPQAPTQTILERNNQAHLQSSLSTFLTNQSEALKNFYTSIQEINTILSTLNAKRG